MPISLAVTFGHLSWFLFLHLLGCFRPVRSPSLRSNKTYWFLLWVHIRKSRVLCLPAATPRLSQLATSFIGVRANPSPRWRLRVGTYYGDLDFTWRSEAFYGKKRHNNLAFGLKFYSHTDALKVFVAFYLLLSELRCLAKRINNLFQSIIVICASIRQHLLLLRDCSRFCSLNYWL